MHPIIQQGIEFFLQWIDFFLHLDQHLSQFVADWGAWTYALLFLIVFCETGLVVTPFLPGDSLLFATGAIVALPASGLQFWEMAGTLLVAAVAGDAVNYAVGNKLGPVVFNRPDSRWLKREHLVRTHEFYEKYGGKTIILARFIPIIRTFAPFVAGVGQMSYRRFAAYNVLGGVLWVFGFLGAGYQFGNLPSIKRNFHFVILGIIIVSIMPAIIEWWRARRPRALSSRS